LYQFDASIASGIGDINHKVKIKKLWHLILMPKSHCSTSELFTSKKLTKFSEVNKNIIKMQNEKKADLHQINKLGNSFSKTLGENKEITRSLQVLHKISNKIGKHIVLSPRISGSGSCVFISTSSWFWLQIAKLILIKISIASRIRENFVSTYSK
jgi:4-diphosphocytidyl-2C-methyl-D-erythritol kinase